MKKYLFITFLILSIAYIGQAQTEPSFGIGVSGNYGSYDRFGG